VNLEFSFIAWFLVFARAGALVAVFPLFSATSVPVHLRVGLAALIAFLAAPFVAVPASVSSFWTLAGFMFTEVSVGLLLGFICRLIFFAVDLAGGIVATEMGLMLSSTFNPLTSAALPVPATILFWLAMMLLLCLNLHHWIIGAFQHAYVLVPVGGAHMSEGLALEVIKRTGEIFQVALQMSAPVMAVSFVITLIFSVLSRAVPKMNVFAESFSVKSLAGLAVFGFTCHLMAQHIENYLRRLPEDMVRIAHLLGPGAGL
jgi:flagellar biosynthetic protein FliR